jgi:lysozyme
MTYTKNPKIVKPKLNLRNTLLGLGFSSAVVISATQLTAPSEGLVMAPYLDIAGVATTCYGTTDRNNIGVVIKDKAYTEQECTVMLANELAEIEKQITPMIKVSVNDYQKAAFLDFSYNVGVGAFQKSSVLGFLNAGNTKASCESLMKYVFAGDCKEGQKNCVLTASGKWKLKLNGLVERRNLEMKYCLGEIKLQDDRK